MLERVHYFSTGDMSIPLYMERAARIVNGVYDNHNDKQNDSQNDKLSDSVRKTYHRGQAPVIGLISKADAKKCIGLFLFAYCCLYTPTTLYIFNIKFLGIFDSTEFPSTI